jgi:hypothetical protein
MGAELGEESMLEQESIELRAVTAKVEEGRFIVRVKVFNPKERTLYAYGEARRVLYDDATGILTVHLHDQHVEEDTIISRHLRQPRFVPLEGNTETEIALSLPKVIKRLRSAAERGESGPVSEQLHISEATRIELEIAHQDTPFYYNPKEDNARQLKQWGHTIAKGTFDLERPETQGDEYSA